MKESYKKEAFPALLEKFHYGNVMEVPKLEKITLNMGLGEAKDNTKLMETAVEEMAAISGQRPVVTKAKKSIANFKVRAGMPVGCKVTLRGDNMYLFADKFFNIVLPRVRDFKGVSKNSFDGRGNYSMGVKEQSIFPEIVYDKVDKVKGMNIIFTTSAKTDEEAAALLTLLGMPFEKPIPQRQDDVSADKLRREKGDGEDISQNKAAEKTEIPD
jgi:large subunit ribosomal protein L5